MGTATKLQPIKMQVAMLEPLFTRSILHSTTKGRAEQPAVCTAFTGDAELVLQHVMIRASLRVVGHTIQIENAFNTHSVCLPGALELFSAWPDNASLHNNT